MDPKKSAQLDPKIREIYDRVMNTPLKPTSTSSQTPVPAPVQKPNPSLEAVPQNQPQPINPQPIPGNSSLFVAGKDNTKEPVADNNQEVKKKGISPSLIILGLIVFFVVYALVWVKFFHLSIPFLPL